MHKDLVYKKEEVKFNIIIKQYKNLIIFQEKGNIIRIDPKFLIM